MRTETYFLLAYSVDNDLHTCRIRPNNCLNLPSKSYFSEFKFVFACNICQRFCLSQGGKNAARQVFLKFNLFYQLSPINIRLLYIKFCTYIINKITLCGSPKKLKILKNWPIDYKYCSPLIYHALEYSATKRRSPAKKVKIG